MFISVKEAMELTGMSSTTIYRLCNKRINTLYIRKEDNKFLIDKEFILATYPQDIVKNTEKLENEIIPPIIKPENIIFEIEDLKEPISIPNETNALGSSLSNETNDTIEIPTIAETKIKEWDQENIEPVKETAIKTNLTDNEKIIKKIVKEVVESSQVKSKSLKIFNSETLIGISISIVIIGLLIYLLYLDIK